MLVDLIVYLVKLVYGWKRLEDGGHKRPWRFNWKFLFIELRSVVEMSPEMR